MGKPYAEMTEEEKERVRERQRKYYQNLPEEQRERRREVTREYRQNMSEEQREREREYARKYRQTMSEEQRERKRERDRKYRQNMSEEQRERAREERNERHRNMSKEQREGVRERKREYQRNQFEEQRSRASSGRELAVWAARRAREIARRARRRNIVFALTAADILAVFGDRCPVLGAEWYAGGRGTAPSVDRVDNSKGYVPGNIAVVSCRANEIKKDASISELRAIADFYERKLREMADDLV